MGYPPHQLLSTVARIAEQLKEQLIPNGSNNLNSLNKESSHQNLEFPVMSDDCKRKKLETLRIMDKFSAPRTIPVS